MTEPQHKIPLLKRNWVQNLLTLLLVLVIYLAIRPFMQGEVIEGKAPELNTTSITGQPIQLAHYQGQPVLIHFWATWCPICDFAKDGIEQVAKDYAVINIATQSDDDTALIAYAKSNQMNADIIVNDQEGQLMKRFGARAVPASFLVDKDGNIAFVEVGYSTSIGLKLRLWWLSH
ncbi:MAG: protein disulfide oxidoreductase [Piscirickettsiaceae bacterium CG_4_9_14_3_um_filter_43_564]|nr:protein disulfide oxidoreductase [Thiomicrospira sp.]OIP96031.1 MAG: protein disulfide oxidoreductase [Thiomicrospira sp. CG2_30_44_34]PIQ06018.1 MAG: protein disulfide oxidoreductase [Piscirickettsiaceae bacterium CG18_big_fil_WC_8_21_14_2_50_44_103]PIU38179.1 MAG: protein disulfide oxidoreductase [Piscirickettsiaceae bacterium CG07_land_8_20_14_0_80_44_28]PIW58796.1 MAG: protein disulfide oxidoreductase [Piscirickettsiaceae bacterium CG12_big_fil_rev_8_21_14_0_65_44_934]PIW78642.1 MAG: pr